MSIALYTVDKSGWPEGPWMNEPDVVLFRSKYDYPCAVIRQPELGHLCGYICVPYDHPWASCDQEVLDKIVVHGGITWCSDRLPSQVDVPQLVENGFDPIDNHGTWLGFDCHHSGDLAPNDEHPNSQYRNIGFVLEQMAHLAKQALEATVVVIDDTPLFRGYID